MEQGDLMSLLENLLGPAAAGVAAPHQAGVYHDDEAPDSYLDAENEQSMPGALRRWPNTLYPVVVLVALYSK